MQHAEAAGDLFGRQDFRVKPGRDTDVGNASQFPHAFSRAGKPEATRLLVACGLPCFLLKLGKEPGGVGGKLGQTAGGSERSDDAGGVPGRSAGEPVPFQQDDLFGAKLAEVIGDRQANDPAA